MTETDCCDIPHAKSGLDFYVTVRDGNRNGWLLGPYADHADALANVERGKRLANDANDRAWSYAYGTASLPAGTPVHTVFGA